MAIQKYQCPECDAVHTAEQWNAETIIKYGIPITEIDEVDCSCSFVCPNCKEVIFTADIIEK